MKTKTYNLPSRVRSALRRLWLYSPQRTAALQKARIKRGVYRCAKCKKPAPAKGVAVDHVQPAGALSPDLSNLTEFAQRLFFNRLQVLCDECHEVKTKAENEARKSQREVTGKNTATKKES